MLPTVRVKTPDGVALAVASALLLAFLVEVAAPAATRLTYGFSAYYTAARLVREGQNVARFYDDPWFFDQTARLGVPGARDVYTPNPPTAALLLWPLADLDPITAKAVWTGLNLLFLGLAGAGLVKLGRGGPLTAALGIALIASFQPIQEEVRLGQAYALVLVLEVALLRGYLTDGDRVAGLALGLIIGFKTAGLGFLALMIGQRRWRSLAGAVATVGGIVLLSLPWLGLAGWQRYLALSPRLDAHPELSVTAYQDLPGLWLHLFRPDPTWNPAPLLPLPWLSAALVVASTLVLAGVTLRLTLAADRTRAEARSLAFAAWATLSVILSPFSQDYQYTLVLVPIAILYAQWRENRRDWRTPAVLFVAVILIGAPIPYKAPALAAGGWAILAYPKLYGALLLWTLAMTALSKRFARASNVTRRTH